MTKEKIILECHPRTKNINKDLLKNINDADDTSFLIVGKTKDITTITETIINIALNFIKLKTEYIL